MLWNWYTVDACFLASSWHIRNGGMFAASCVGVVLLSASLEVLRRIGKDYDAHMHRQWTSRAAQQSILRAGQLHGKIDHHGPLSITFRASPLQQLVRATLHAATFALAYIVMLLTMYFNGYIFLSIILGAGLGKFFSDWATTTISLDCPATAVTRVAGIEEATVCCG